MSSHEFIANGYDVLIAPEDASGLAEAAQILSSAGASQNKDDPADVAKAAFAALKADKHKVLPTIKNKVMGAVADALPTTTAAQIHRGLSEPGSANE